MIVAKLWITLALVQMSQSTGLLNSHRILSFGQAAHFEDTVHICIPSNGNVLKHFNMSDVFIYNSK